MYQIRKLYFVLVIVSLLVGTTSGLALAQDGAQDEPYHLMLPQISSGGSAETDTLVYTVPAAEQRAALEYWSSFEARAAAEPLQAPAISEEDLGAAGQLDVSGAPGFARSGPPAPEADEVAQAAYAEEWLRPDELDAALAMLEAAEAEEEFGTKNVYTSYLTNYYTESWKQYPFRAVGKLYITGGGYCSAAVVSPKNILVTAGHCVYDRSTKKWKAGWTFAPADRSGSAPYGLWSAHHARALNNYINSGGIRYDVALVKLNSKWINSAWRPVSYYTGYLGRSWNYGYTQSLHATGYPSNLSSGKYTYTCAAETFGYSTDVLGMGCDMQHGSSGGPWIRVYYPYRSGAFNYVNAVVSGVPSGEPIGTTFYGPRFSSSNIVILCNDEGC